LRLNPNSNLLLKNNLPRKRKYALSSLRISFGLSQFSG